MDTRECIMKHKDPPWGCYGAPAKMPQRSYVDPATQTRWSQQRKSVTPQQQSIERDQTSAHSCLIYYNDHLSNCNNTHKLWSGISEPWRHNILYIQNEKLHLTGTLDTSHYTQFIVPICLRVLQNRLNKARISARRHFVMSIIKTRCISNA